MKNENVNSRRQTENMEMLNASKWPSSRLGATRRPGMKQARGGEERGEEGRSPEEMGEGSPDGRSRGERGELGEKQICDSVTKWKGTLWEFNTSEASHTRAPTVTNRLRDTYTSKHVKTKEIYK